MFGHKTWHFSPKLRRDKPEDSRDARQANDDSSTTSTCVSTPRSTWGALRSFWASVQIKPPGLRTSPTPRRQRSATPSTPVNMLAFRSITTILAYIQQRQVLERKPTPHEEEYALDLKVANAVSTILVVHHDVAAVSFRRTVEEIGVVTCTNPSGDRKGSSNPPQQSKLSGIVCSTNPRPDDPIYDISTGKIKAITATDEGRLLETTQELREYIEAKCSPGRVISLPTHIFILKKILTLDRNTTAGDTAVGATTTSGADTDTTTRTTMEYLLRRHVINTCFPKMLRRLTDKLSNPFLASLRTINKLSEKEFLLGLKQSDVHAGERSTPKVNAYDQALIESFILRIDPERIPKIHEDLSKGNFSVLYTAEARKDFHVVIMEILEKFLRGLQDLYDLQFKFEDDGVVLDDEHVATYQKDLKTVELASQGLQHLTKGTILQIHLQAIEEMLFDVHPLNGYSNSNSNSNNVVNNNDENNDNGRDEALEAVQPSVIEESTCKPTTLLESYNNWLCLMVVHLDASSILTQFFSDSRYYQGQDISLQMLHIPVACPNLLSLEDLLRGPKYLPPISDSSQSNDDIYRFFINSTTGKGAQRVRNAVKKVVQAWQEDDFSAKVTATTTCVDDLIKLASSPGSGWTSLAKQAIELSNKLVSLSSQAALPTFSAHNLVGNGIIEDIDNRIRNLKENIDFFDGLVRAMKKFSGTTHCEAILASLLDNSHGISVDNAYKDIQQKLRGFTRVIGVSKRCCPTCHHLLSLLGSKQRPYLVRGAHNTISACTLPAWLPDNIVDEMNSHFGKVLRGELEALMELDAFSQPRTKSVSSDKLSDIGTGPEVGPQFQYIPSSEFENSSW